MVLDDATVTAFVCRAILFEFRIKIKWLDATYIDRQIDERVTQHKLNQTRGKKTAHKRQEEKSSCRKKKYQIEKLKQKYIFTQIQNEWNAYNHQHTYVML